MPREKGQRQIDRHGASTPRQSGKALREEHNIEVRQALYRKSGNWYHQLRTFPAALMDAGGYVIFANEEDYQTNRFLRIGKEVGVPGGIARMKEYASSRAAASTQK